MRIGASTQGSFSRDSSGISAGNAGVFVILYVSESVREATAGKLRIPEVCTLQAGEAIGSVESVAGGAAARPLGD